jgi:hypothetical protein
MVQGVVEASLAEVLSQPHDRLLDGPRGAPTARVRASRPGASASSPPTRSRPTSTETQLLDTPWARATSRTLLFSITTASTT